MKSIYIIVSLLALGLWGCRHGTDVPIVPTTEVSFKLGVDARLLSPNGDYRLGDSAQVSFQSIKFYINNLALLDTVGKALATDSSHYLVIWNGTSSPAFKAQLKEYLGVAKRIRFSIGVRPYQNHTLVNEADLDPTKGMSWEWETGYKFIAIEGNLRKQETIEIKPWVWHIGRDEAFRTITLPISQIPSGVPPTRLTIETNFSSLFSSPNLLNPVLDYSEVMFDRAQSAKVADNFIACFQSAKAE